MEAESVPLIKVISEPALACQDVSSANMFMESIRQDNVSNVEKILHNNPPVKSILTHWVGAPYLATPFELACMEGSIKIMNVILKHLGDAKKLSDLTQGENTPLHYSAQKGNHGVLLMLIELEIFNVNSKNNIRQTPLHLAARYGHLSCVETLVSQDKIQIDPVDSNNETPLHMAASNGHFNIVKTLLSRNASVTKRSRYGQTPLHNAAFKGKSEIALELLKCSADPTAFDEDMDTALHFLRKDCHPKLLGMFLKEGALLGAVNKVGVTPLNGLDPSVLQEVLDGAVCAVPIPDHEQNRHMKDDVKLMFKNPFTTFYSETDKSDLKNFISISNSKPHEYLVFHPFFRALIQMKLQILQKFYFMRMLLFFLFAISVSAHIFVADEIVETQQNDVNATDYQGSFNAGMRNSSYYWFSVVVWCLLTFLGCLKFIEVIFEWRYSYKDLTNWLELFIYALTVCYFLNWNEVTFFLLLLLWVMVFLTASRYPPFSTLFYIFLYISKRFFKFFLFSSTLLIGFLLSFHFLFKRKEEGSLRNDGCSDSSDRVFTYNFASAALRLSAMMLGEVGYDQLPLEYKFNHWGVLLALYIFFICFVLFNMMNGLAVSDTSDLIKRAKFSTIIAQANMILSIESQMDSLWWWKNVLQYLKLFTVPRICTFTILPSTGLCLEGNMTSCTKGYYLPLDIVDEALLLTKVEKTELNTEQMKLKEFTERLEQLRKDLEYFSNTYNKKLNDRL